jgi:uncharacterized protein (TIRG00374 family)
MKKLIKSLLALVVGVVIFYFVVEKTGITSLSRAKNIFFSYKGFFIILVTFLSILVNVYRWKFVLSCHGEEKGFFELFKVWLVSYFFTYITPISLVGGEAVKVYLSRKILNIRWDNSFSTVIIDKVLDITFHILFTVVGLIIFFNYGNFPTFWILFLVLFVIFWLTAILTVFYSRAFSKKSIILWFLNLLNLEKTKVKSTKNGELLFNVEGNVLRFFSPKKLFFWKGVFLGFLKHLFLYLKAALLVFFLVQSFHPLKNIAVQALVNLSVLIPIPVGLGSMEAVISFGFKTLDLGFENGAILAMVWRAANLTICLLSLVFGVKIGLQLFKLKTFNFIDKITESNYKNK